MGMVFGKIRVETPKYELVHSCEDYEIRKYGASVVAEITYDPKQMKGGDKDGGFTILASYIGVFGNPQNSNPEKIAMTTPVITKTQPEPEKIAMTTPVITKGDEGFVTMQFILPSKYQKKEDAPKPTDERVVIKEEGERKFGIVKFSGVATDKVVEEKVKKLRECLERDEHKVKNGGEEFLLARYNPPWTLPPFRTNEIMILLE